MFDFTLRRGVVGVVLAAIILGPAAASLFAGDTTQSNKSTVVPKDDDKGALLLVRAWDPKSGELVGWLPMHRAAMTLKQVGPGTLDFDLNEAVTIDLPYRPSSDRDELRIAPDYATFQGQKWLPVQRDVNIVRIKKCMFYVKTIAFGNSKWRTAARPPDGK
jgi:hypothetical protein